MKAAYADNVLPNIKRKMIVWSQIVLQVILPLLGSLPVHAASDNGKEAVVVTPYSQEMSTLASSATDGSDGVKSAATSMATGAAASSAEAWLSQFGTASVKLNVDNNGNWDDSSVDLLVPVYDSKKSLFFTQLGLRAPDGRTTGNAGLGMRTFYSDRWMFGGNAFFDDDFTGKNRRVGFGAEAWTDYLKLAANTYIGTTQWHHSRDFDDYNEKPADGFDIRVEGYLPKYPQLGTKLMYEQYYGDQVALFDKDHLQSNPSAVTIGLNYTPIPLITAGVDYKRGQDSMDETRFSLNFRYNLGQTWQSQISPDQVAARRSLAGSRTDLVDRNNDIILQYKKKEDVGALTDMTLTNVSDNSPADGLTRNSVAVHAVAADGKPASHAEIAWSVTGNAKLSAATSVTDDSGNASVSFTNTTAEQVILTASAGTVTRTTPSAFIQYVASLNLQLTRNNSQANGADQNAGQVTLKDANGKPMPGIALNWLVGSPGTLVSSDRTTNNNGLATVHFTSVTPGTVKLTASALGKTESVNATFANLAVSVVAVSLQTNNAVANGVATNVAQALVTDALNQPVSGVSVNWSFGAGSAKAVSPMTTVSNSQGIATFSFSNTVAEASTVTATAGGQSGSATAIFTADNATARVSALNINTDGSTANGTAQNSATATVVDASGNPLANTTVNWTVTGSARLAGATSTTNASGQAVITFTDTKAETVTITAKAGSADAGQSKTSSFLADTTTAQVNALNINTDGSTANGTAQNSATATVVDASGNPLANTTVNWTVTGSARLAGATSATNASGQAIITFTDATAETVTITAKAGSADAGQSKTSSFLADTTTAQVSALNVDTDGSAANGTAQNSATATVVDASGNPLANTTVNWTVTGSARLAGATSTTNASGQAVITFTDTKAETVTITAKAGSADAGQSKTSSFLADTTTAQVSALNVDTDGSAANGTAQNSATATVVDASGNPLANTTVNWTVTGSARLAGATSATNASGQAVITFTDNKVEVVTLTAKTGSTDAGQSKTSSFVADTATAQVSALSVDTDGSTANGTAQNSATATVVDASGNLLANTTVNWTVTGSAQLAGATSTTNASGQAIITFTDTKAETVTITAKASSSDAGQSKTSSFQADMNSATLQSLSVTKDKSPADGATQNTAEVYVKDINGNPLSGIAVTWSADKTTVALVPGGVTDSTGKATVSFTDKTAEVIQLTAALSNGSMLAGTSEFVIDVAGLQIFRFETASTAYVHDSTVVRLYVVDRFGNSVNGANAHLSVTGSAQLAATSVVTGEESACHGCAIVNITDSTIETVTVTATLDNNVSAQTDASFVQSLATAIIITVTQDGKGIDVPNTVTAKAVDGNGYPVPGYEIRWALGSYTSQFNFSNITAVTDQDGEVTTSIQRKSSSSYTGQLTLTAYGESYFTNNPEATTSMTFARGN